MSNEMMLELHFIWHRRCLFIVLLKLAKQHRKNVGDIISFNIVAVHLKHG